MNPVVTPTPSVTFIPLPVNSNISTEITDEERKAKRILMQQRLRAHYASQRK